MNKTEENNARAKALGEEKISRLLWKFSLPAIAGMVVNALYNVVDSIFVGHGVGETGLAAVTIAFPIMIVLMGFAMLVGVGASAAVSLRMGENRQDEAEKILGNACTLGLVLSAVLTGVTLWLLDDLLILLGAQPSVLPYARDFTWIIVAGSIFMYMSFGLNSVIRAEGNPRRAMVNIMVSAGLNMVLNPLFIFGMKLGISGSALATVIAQAVAAVMVLTYFRSSHSVLKLRLCNLRLEKEIITGIFRIGMSPFLMQISASVVTIIINFTLLRYGGELAVAAIGVINRIAMLMLMPIFGISQGLQPIIGYNYGAQNFIRVRRALRLAIVAATVFSTTGFVLVQLLDEEIIMLFNSNPELIALGAHAMRVYLLMLPVIGFQIIGSNYFQAVDKAVYAIVLGLSRQVILLIPLVVLLPQWLGLTGIWLASPAADGIAALATGIVLARELRSLKQGSTLRASD